MEDLLDDFNSYPLVQKLLVFGSLVAVLFLGFWYLMYSPLTAEIDDQQEELRRLERKRGELQTEKENQKRIRNEIEDLQQEIAVAQDKLPNAPDVSGLLRAFNEKAKMAGLEINDINKQSENEKKYYVEIPVKMEFEGTFTEMTDFFQFVDRMNRIINFRDLSLNRKSGGDSAQPGTLKIQATATAFRYDDSKK